MEFQRLSEGKGSKKAKHRPSLENRVCSKKLEFVRK